MTRAGQCAKLFLGCYDLLDQLCIASSTLAVSCTVQTWAKAAEKERSGIGPKRNNPITLSDEFVCFCGKPDPVGGERLEDMVQDGLWATPGAAVVRKAFRLGPFDLRIEERKYCGDVPAAEGVVEATNDSDGCSHDGLLCGTGGRVAVRTPRP
jgi:hypothetical protein